MLKRTCSDCCALDTTMRGPCQLGYQVNTTGLWPHVRYAPAEECPKPRSIRAYIAERERLALNGTKVPA